MAKSSSTWQTGRSGNPKGRPAGTGRVEEYRQLLDPYIPELLQVLVGKAKDGDLAALRLVLDRVYPLRDAAVADLLADIEELRELIREHKSIGRDEELAGLLREVEELRQMAKDRSAMQ